MQATENQKNIIKDLKIFIDSLERKDINSSVIKIQEEIHDLTDQMTKEEKIKDDDEHKLDIYLLGILELIRKNE